MSEVNNVINLKKKKKETKQKEKEKYDKLIKIIDEYIEKNLNGNDIKSLILNNIADVKEDFLDTIIKKRFEENSKRKEQLNKYKYTWYSVNEKGKVTIIYNQLADHIINKYHILMITPFLHYYYKGVYKMLTDVELKTLIKLHLTEEFKTPYNITQVFILITEMSSQIVAKIDDFDSNKNIINFKNGLYDISQDKLLKHTPKYKSLFQLNCNYNKKAICPTWEAFIKDALLNDDDTINVLEEMLGYMIVKDITAQKMFLLHGKSNTGKSVVLSLYKHLIGSDMYTSITLQEFSKSDSKLIHQLRGKMANVCGDLPQKPITDTGLIKQLTGEDEVTTDIKFKEAITFRNYAILLFSTNGMPTNHTDKSEAFYNRLVIIPFNNVKKGKERDVELKDKLYSEAEGIVLRLIEGLKRLRRNKYIFTNSEAVNNELKAYKVKNDTVLAFIDDVYIVVKESDIERLKVNPKTYTNLYDEYVRYCEYMQFGHCNKKVFKEILLNNPDIIYKERTKNARNVVLNLQLNPDIEHDLAMLLIQKY